MKHFGGSTTRYVAVGIRLALAVVRYDWAQKLTIMASKPVTIEKFLGERPHGSKNLGCEGLLLHWRGVILGRQFSFFLVSAASSCHFFDVPRIYRKKQKHILSKETDD